MSLSKDITKHKEEILSLGRLNIWRCSAERRNSDTWWRRSVTAGSLQEDGRCQAADAVSWDEEWTLDTCLRVCGHGVGFELHPAVN